jgi:hypothetical protein
MDLERKIWDRKIPATALEQIPASCPHPLFGKERRKVLARLNGSF